MQKRNERSQEDHHQSLLLHCPFLLFSWTIMYTCPSCRGCKESLGTEIASIWEEGEDLFDFPWDKILEFPSYQVYRSMKLELLL